jgi:hypothetical protein
MYYPSIIFLSLLSFSTLVFSSSIDKAYEIKINGHSYAIHLNKLLTIKDNTGKKTRLVLYKKEYSQYSDDHLSFQYPTSIKMERDDSDNNVRQISLSTPSNSLFYILEYNNFDPSSMVAGLVDKLTQKLVNKGYSKRSRNITIKLTTGEELVGIKTKLKYKKHKKYWHVLSYSNAKNGVIVITYMDKKYFYSDRKIMDDFFKSLRFNNKLKQSQVQNEVFEEQSDIPVLCQKIIAIAGKTPNDAIAIMGKPDTIKKQSVANSFNPKITDQKVALHYGQSVIHYYHASSAHKYLLTQIKFSHQDFNKSLALIFPKTMAKLIEKYGTPDHRSSSSHRYYCSEEGNEWLDVYYDDQKDFIGFEFSGYSG